MDKRLGNLHLVNKRSGLSLLEVALAVGIFVLLMAAMSSGLFSLRKEAALQSFADEIISLLNQAKFKTLASEGAVQYGVHFESGRAVLFKGAVFTEGAPDNQELNPPSFVEIAPISLEGGGPDVIFERLTGKTNNSGTVGLRLKTDPSHAKTIVIGAMGAVGGQ